MHENSQYTDNILRNAYINEKRKNLLLKLICLLLHRLLRTIVNYYIKAEKFVFEKLYDVHFYPRTVSPSYKRMLRHCVYTGCSLIVRIFQMM